MENLIDYIQTIKDKESYLNINSINLQDKTAELQIETNNDIRYFVVAHEKENINIQELEMISTRLNEDLKSKDIEAFIDDLEDFLFSWTI